MKDLVELVVKALVDRPELVVVATIEGQQSIVFEVRVDAEDMGKVIGKGGRTANALRAVVKAAGAHLEKSIWVDVDRLPDQPAFVR
jgi:predicted RNA-binding protein YlqC (UPF0109 family)